MSDEDSDNKCPMPAINDMNEGMVALFKTFMRSEDYIEALDFVDDCLGFLPTSFVINEIIFKIMKNCNGRFAYKVANYLESSWKTMSTNNDQKNNFILGLKDESSTKPDVWNAFSHFVWSSLHHLGVPEANHSHKVYVKSPNCELLVHIYVKAFLKCSIKRDIFGSRAAERMSSILKWISLYYKYNFDGEPVLSSLHKLLYYIVDSEISNGTSLPSCVKIHTANLSQDMSLILNICRDVFASPEKQQKFFIYTMSPYFALKVCQYRLHELIDEKSLPQKPGMLTLKSIVQNYCFHEQQKDSSVRKSMPPKPPRVEKLKKFSKDAISGDTNLHERCRLGRPADLLCVLYAEKNQDINIKNSAGNTPLHEACLASSYLCCKFLIEEAGDRKVDFRATENEGRTPLHCAVYVDAFDIVKLLLDRGGKDLIKYKDNCGKMPIDYSTSDEMRKMLQELEPKFQESNDLKLPCLKNSEYFHLYLQTLRTLIANYNEIYNLPKTGARTLSHDSKECYHYKADCETLCMEDSSTLDTFHNVIKKFISCANLISKDESTKKQLFHWNMFETTFK